MVAKAKKPAKKAAVKKQTVKDLDAGKKASKVKGGLVQNSVNICS